MKDYQDEVIKDLQDNYFHDFKIAFDQFLLDFIESKNYILENDICDKDEVINDLREDYLLRILKLR